MVILGTLAAIAVPKMGNSKDGAVYSSMKSDARLAIAEAQSYIFRQSFLFFSSI